MQIPTDVLAVLDHAETTGHELRLTGTLDRQLYVRTNKTLEAAGGKWNKKARAHLFDNPAADVLDAILSTGEVTSPRDFGYFPTPPNVVDRLIELADLRPGMDVLEPSAGRGAIVSRLHAAGCKVTCIELLADNAAHLTDAGAHQFLVADFLAVGPMRGFERVVMNPPFAKQADIRHVMHAHRFLLGGGLLVAVMSNGVTFRDNALTGEFRALMDRVGGSLEPLPEGSFQVSGTGVNTVIAVLPAA
jgi:hypothetical protein